METTKKLQGDYGEFVFEHFCLEKEYAYIGLEEIYNNLRPNNKLRFRFGYDRIEVAIPDEIVEEVKRICRPSNNSDSDPSFVFDYFTMSLKYNFTKIVDNRGNVSYSQHSLTTPKDFSWAEVKTGKSRLSRNQRQTIKGCKIWVYIFRIPVEIPETIQVNWNRLKPIQVEESRKYSKEELMAIGYSEEDIFGSFNWDEDGQFFIS